MNAKGFREGGGGDFLLHGAPLHTEAAVGAAE